MLQVTKQGFMKTDKMGIAYTMAAHFGFINPQLTLTEKFLLMSEETQ